MKRILITGKNSYVGISVKNWLEKYPNHYEIYTISMRNDQWKSMDLSKYDVVFHVAGIAHVSANPKMKNEYYRVNRDLTYEVARKAKEDGVKQFIFMSSIIIYGDSRNEQGFIDKDTIPKPRDFYGDSKLQAESAITPLEAEGFNIAIIRPPMIYGKGSKGNYAKLSKLSRTIPIFPDIENKRSMLYIDNLCELVRKLLDNNEKGFYYPQNAEYVNTSQLVKMIAEVHGKNPILTKTFNAVFMRMQDKLNVINKLFGTLAYELTLSECSFEYRVSTLTESIIKSETV